jgi:cytochrome b561
MSSADSNLEGSQRYTRVAIFLHWVMALGILALIVLGLTMTHAKLPLVRKFQLYQLHKSLGITVLLAALVRLAWRVTHRSPPLPADMTSLERSAAVGGHLTLYILLFGLPLTGWALVSASALNVPTLLYGHIHWPHLPMLPTLPHKARIEAALKLVHHYAAWTLIVMVVGHIGAALRHHFHQHDEVLRRMLPFGRSRSVP